MTTFRDRNTLQTNARTVSTEIYTNKLYNDTLQHESRRKNSDTSNENTAIHLDKTKEK